jgi:hypothetical protein
VLACPRELSRLIALDELRIVLALDAADLHKHRRLEIDPWSPDVVAYVVAVLLRREPGCRPLTGVNLQARDSARRLRFLAWPCPLSQGIP